MNWSEWWLSMVFIIMIILCLVIVWWFWLWWMFGSLWSVVGGMHCLCLFAVWCLFVFWMIDWLIDWLIELGSHLPQRIHHFCTVLGECLVFAHFVGCVPIPRPFCLDSFDTVPVQCVVTGDYWRVSKYSILLVKLSTLFLLTPSNVNMIACTGIFWSSFMVEMWLGGTREVMPIFMVMMVFVLNFIIWPKEHKQHKQRKISRFHFFFVFCLFVFLQCKIRQSIIQNTNKHHTANNMQHATPTPGVKWTDPSGYSVETEYQVYSIPE